MNLGSLFSMGGYAGAGPQQPDMSNQLDQGDFSSPTLAAMYNPQQAAQQAPQVGPSPSAMKGTPGSTAEAIQSVNSPASTSPWQFSNGGLTQQQGIKAPTYSDAGFTPFGVAKNLADPALQMTLNAAGAGNLKSGLSAFLGTTTNNPFTDISGASANGGSTYSMSDMSGLAKQMNIDLTGHTGNALDTQTYLNDKLKDYYQINGLSEGWNNQGNARGANTTLYRRENGQLVPIQTSNYVAPQTGGFLKQNMGLLAPLGVLAGGAGLAAMGAGSGAASTGLGAAFHSLPAMAQSALTGAAVGGGTAGLTGGNVLKGALLGGLTGGLGSGISSGLQGMGVGQGLANFGGNALARTGVGLSQGQSLSDMFNQRSLVSMLGSLGGGALGSAIDPRLAGLGSFGGRTLASIYNRR